MNARLLLLAFPLLMGGCTGILHELKAPPFPYVIVHHTRAVGIEAQIPNQAGDSVVKFRLGFFSDSWQMIPCATNDMKIPAISDTFKLGSEISFSPSTSIVEDFESGWTGQPPPARYGNLFTHEVKLAPVVPSKGTP